MAKIRQATKEDADKVGLTYSVNSLFWVWTEKKKKVFFSGFRRGNAMEIHLASKNGKGRIGRAVDAFCKYLFKSYPWCQRITGTLDNKNIIALSIKTGFKVIAEFPATVAGQHKILTLIERAR